jgi:hypothetical protein
MIQFKMKNLALAAAIVGALAGPARAQTTIPGAPIVPLGSCQIGATALGSAVKLSSCVRASFTASAGSPATQLVVTSVTGIIAPGDQIVSGTGATVGTVIVSQISGTPGGAGTYQLSASNTTSSAAVTTGGIPPGATMAFLQAEVADIRYRDDGGAPTTAIGNLIVHGIPGIFYAGTLSQLQFIGASGSPLLDIAFYR